MDINQASDVITSSLGIIVVEDKPALISMLNKSGTTLPSTATDKDILSASFKALKDSLRFRNELQQYLKNSVAEESFKNYVDEDFYNNTGAFQIGSIVGGQTASATKTNKTATTNKTSKKIKDGGSGTGAGNFLRSLTSKENIDTLINAGVGFAATKIQQSAAKQGEQRAIDFEVAKAQAAAAEAEAARVKDATKKRNAWVVPVAVIGGLAILGTVVYFAVRKKA